MVESEERRDFFRIEDTVTMQLAPVIAGDSGEPKLPDVFLTLNQLRRLDSENSQLLRLIQDKHRDVARYLSMQNEKFELLSQMLVKQLESSFSKYNVNISGSGLKLSLEQPAEIGSEWHLTILLYPDCFGFYTKGKVSQCDQEPETGNYQIAFEFTELKQHDQDELVKHITKMQSKQLRKERLGD
ncbi:PilZ domain-containing protein [Pleionea litopenaei]|uniref:PilZ domain-containing protein n=1 Tax=Pleionea litopenaei TaxID=3070815 RepID=A0AA51RUV3_9GAMM|nr:PilZ domain-containing protein [Pleionea sp. HL-JVS1]WMS88051.1 PilZ domain-containing protein [Pleionea sp. HL-JVS1]